MIIYCLPKLIIYVSDFLVYYVGADHLPYTRAKLGIAIFFPFYLGKRPQGFCAKATYNTVLFSVTHIYPVYSGVYTP